MPGPVRHPADDLLAQAQLVEDDAGDLQVGALVAAAHVVDLAGLAVLEHELDAGAVVVHVEPVADVQPVAVERQLLALEGVGHEERDELLRILVRPVGVRAPGDHGRHPVGVVIGEHLQVAARFGGGVGAGGSQRIVLGAGAFVDRPVHLVGGHLHHAGDAQLADGFEERVDAEDVGAKERLRVDDGAVHVGLGGEVDDGVHAFGRPRDRLPVADVGADEPVAGVGLHRRAGCPGCRRR